MKKNKKKLLLVASLFALLCGGIVYYYFFSPINQTASKEYLYIDNDDNVDSLYSKLSSFASSSAMSGFKILVENTDNFKVKSGRYEVNRSIGAFRLYRNVKNGMQTPQNITIPSIRTKEQLCGKISSKLMLDSLDLLKAINNNENCKKYGYDTTTIISMFIPETYEIYWNISVEHFLDKIKKESDKFWNEQRTSKAKALNLSPIEVITLASIVDEETANDKEKPMVAGMYYNRLMLRNSEYPKGMPLQADPTIKFALKQFDIKRIYNNMLQVNSPYNTYKNTGLPPSPIRIPSIYGIDAVLNLVKHDYIYMCAKEDFSGTHNFASTYAEHMKNAKKYSEALNKRGIK